MLFDLRQPDILSLLYVQNRLFFLVSISLLGFIRQIKAAVNPSNT